MGDPHEVYIKLLHDMSDTRKGVPNALIETTLKDMRTQLIGALRHGIDELGRLDFREAPAANSRRNAEIELLEIMIATMGGTN